MKKSLAALALCLASAAAAAQQPAPVTLVVAFSPGGPADRIARILAQPLGDILARPVVVENRPGASGIIAANYVARSEHPGDTLFLSNAGVLTINPALYPDLKYDPVKDFKPVSLVADTTTVLVTWAPTEVKDAADLVARIRAGGRQWSGGSSGVGSQSHLSLEMFDEGAKVDLLHIPYKGASPLITDLVGKRVDLFIGDLPGVSSLISAGKLKALGVAGDKPSPLLPGVPTLAEQGIPGVAPSGWYGIVMPATAGGAETQAMADAIGRALADPEIRKQYEAMGAMAAPSSAAAFGELLAKDRERWKALVDRRGITVSQ